MTLRIFRIFLCAVIAFTSVAAFAGFDFRPVAQTSVESPQLVIEDEKPAVEEQAAPEVPKPVTLEPVFNMTPVEEEGEPITETAFSADSWTKADDDTAFEAEPVVQAPENILVLEHAPISEPYEPVILNEVQTWRARSGESVRDVLARWSKREGVELVWSTPARKLLAQSVSFVGTFPEAVETLIVDGVGNELHGTLHLPMFKEGGEKNDVEEQSIETAVAPVALTPLKGTHGTMKTWRVNAGEQLEEVLEKWALRENIRFIWRMPETQEIYTVKTSFFMRGSVFEAVEMLLAQYVDYDTRPMGYVYTDEPSNQKVFVIQPPLLREQG